MTHPTPTDAMCNMALRSAVFEILRRHVVSDQCFAEVASVTQAALAHQHDGGEVVGLFTSADTVLAYLQEDQPVPLEAAAALEQTVNKSRDTTAWNANMDEAPRDGSGIDLWCAPLSEDGYELTPCRIPDCFWVSEFQGWYVAATDGDFVRIVHRVTHWQHLPQPPKEQG